MGKDTKGDRKPNKPSSSARAAETLASKAAAGVGVGFGGFMGGTPVATSAPGFAFGGAAAASRTGTADGGAAASSAASDGGGGGASALEPHLVGGGDPLLAAQLDGELAQCLRHLSKKDATTKTKALQNLRALLPSRSTDQVAAALPAWTQCYRRLVLDASRAVRSEAAATLAAFLTAAGKATAPHLRSLMGPWWLAQHDPHADAAAQSRAAFSAAFPSSGSGSRRQLEVLLHCRLQLAAYLRDMMAAAPAQLGDPRKDSPEELEERHERVQAACCAALAQLIDVLAGAGAAAARHPEPQQQQQQQDQEQRQCGRSESADQARAPVAVASTTRPSATPDPESELLAAVQEALCRPGFWRAAAGAKSAMVRRAAYGLARTAATRAPSLLAACVAESAPCVLGALGDKEPGNHGAVWEAVLTYGKYVPEGWSHVNLRKMLLPRLTSLLRHGCYGSAASSLSALLPLLPLLPRGTLGPAPDVLTSLLEAVWAGAADPAAQSRTAQSASLAAYRECLAWGLTNSSALAAGPLQPATGVAAGGTAAVPLAGEPAPSLQPAPELAFCQTLLRGTVLQHVLPALLRRQGGCSAHSSEAASELLTDLAQSLAAASDRQQQQQQQRAGIAAAGSAPGPAAAAAAASCTVAWDCLSQLLQEYLANTLGGLVAGMAAAAADSGGAVPADNSGGPSDMAAACEGVARLLGRLRAASSPACDLLATQAASSAAAGLMACGSALPTAASQLLAALLREHGASRVAAAALSPAPSGGLPPAAPGAGACDLPAAATGALGGGRFRGASAAGGVSLSLSLDSLIASFRDGPVAGAAAAAAADLLVAFCLSRREPDPDPEGGGGAPAGGCGSGAAAALWEQVMAEVLTGGAGGSNDSGAMDAAGSAQARLLRATLLLQRLAESSDCRSGVCAWTSASLDAAAVRLASTAPAEAEADAQAGLLSNALGANPAGLVMLGPAAALSVLQALIARLRTPAAASAPAAAAAAVSALRAPLCDAGCGLWRMLPEAACEAVAALAAAAWQAPVTSDVAADLQAGSDGDEGDDGWESPATSEHEDAAEEEEEQEGQELHGGAGRGAGARDMDVDVDVDEAALPARVLGASEEEEEDDEEQGGSVEQSAWAQASSAAARVWGECRPLAAAAEALPSDVTDALVTRLARDLASAVCGHHQQPQQQQEGQAGADGAVASFRLGARAWAVHAARLVRCVPGGASRRCAAVAALLAADPAWRTWSAPAAAAAAAAAAVPPGGAAVPSLQHLARLLLRLLREEGAGRGLPRPLRGPAGRSGGGSALQDAGAGGCMEWWVVLELLCSHYDAARAAAAAAAADDALQGGATQLPSACWRGAVGRAAEAGLQRLVSAAVLEAAEEEGGGQEDARSAAAAAHAPHPEPHRRHGDLQLRALVDGLAAGCGAAAAAAAPAAEAAYLEGLCRVAVVVERASAAAHARHLRLQQLRGAGEADGLLPPLLPHQQRLCRRWLAACSPGGAAAAAAASASACGLPRRAVCRLLPLVAGPLRRAAACRAGDDGRPAAAAEALLVEAGLPQLAGEWVRHCLAQPAVLGDLRPLPQPQADAEAGPLESLRLAAACFPVPGARGGCASSGSGAAAAAAAAALVRSGGRALAAAERPLLLALVRHQAVRTAGAAAARRQQQRPGAPEAPGRAAAQPVPGQSEEEDQEAQACVTRLQHAAVLYCWQDMGQPDWHVLLQDVQVQLAAAVSALQAVLRHVAAAARAAADGVLGQAPGSTPAGPVALQLLRKLAQRGVLPKLPAAAQLAGACEEAVGGGGIGPAAQAAAQLAAVLAELQGDIAAARVSSTAAGAAATARELGASVSCCYSSALQLAVLAGGLACFTAGLGSCAAAATITHWLAAHDVFWAAVARCTAHALQPGREHLGAAAAAEAVQASTGALEEAGLDVVGAVLALALAPSGGTSGNATPAMVLQLRPAAYRLLLLLGGDSSSLLGRLTLAEAVAAAADGGGGQGSAAGDAADVLPEYEGDDVAYLIAGGVRPEMAPLLLPPQPAAAASSGGGGGCPVSYLAAWSLLLAHALQMDAGSRGLAVLRQLLREAGHLVHGLLGQLVPQLGITGGAGAGAGGAGAAARAKGGRRHGHVAPGAAGRGTGPGGSSGDAGSAAGAAGEAWHLAEVLREVGLPLGRHARRTCCRSLYRAVLRALPATARGWFGDLRDRGLAAAVEAYTAAAEGPALLAAEMEAVQALGKGAATSDSDSKFSVRCSAAAREVVAVLEVEDGAVLELAVRLPACLPLRAPEVECRRKVGVNEGRLRKWLLSISTFLRHQNGSVADAICLWRRNVDSEFAGVEACLICYSVISSVNAQLPRLVCRTCGVRFHPACLYKWFKSAGKSQCPHCQALW
uniref:E3 ubiquitin-protein ligase listerin n=1 Tax=Chlamydomonas reinhardtii TaxID=3055 RepID=D5LAZ2_CHLRE|nr:294687m [Chlamydomonas reinhardtii]